MPFDEWWDRQPRISGSGKDICRAVWHAAVAEERERCAKILDDWPSHYPDDIFIPPPAGEHGYTVDACSAAAIRIICPNIAAAIREG